MALPIIAPATAPPRMPAPTAQPTHSALAGTGATMTAMPIPAAPTSAMNDLCMVSALLRSFGSRSKLGLSEDAANPRIPLHHYRATRVVTEPFVADPRRGAIAYPKPRQAA